MKILPLIISNLTLFISFSVLAQNAKVDSLQKVLTLENAPDKKAIVLMDIGDEYFLYANDTAIYYYEKAYDHAFQTDNDHLKAQVTYKLGLSYQFIDPAKSAEFALETLEYSEKTGDSRYLSYSHNMLGNLYRANGELDKSMEEYKFALSISEQAKDSIQVARAMNNIGIVHMMSAEYDIGLEYWLKSLEIKELLGEEEAAAATMSNIALYYKDIGRYYEAKEFLDKAIEINKKYHDYESIAFCYTIIGDMYWRMNNPASAIVPYKKALAYCDTNNSYFNKADAFVGLSRVLDSLGRYEEALFYNRLYTEVVMDFHDDKNARITRELTTQFETEKKEQENELLKKQGEAKDAKIALEQANFRYLLLGLFGLLAIIVLIVYILTRVRAAKKEIENQKHIVEEKNQEILDSITYAKRLQNAILPTQETIDAHLKENFVLYLPKDIVAGDFYWMDYADGKTLLAVADCTGHGVPGAMVSVVCHNALNRAVREFGLREPGKILDKVTDLVIETFEKSTEEVKDGMDICLCSFDFENNQVLYSGANNGLYHIVNGELVEIKPDKQPVGKYADRQPFTTHSISSKKGDVFYLFTDGYADQFGGEKGKKLKYKPFKEILLNNSQSNMWNQRTVLFDKFQTWKGDYEQIDDVCVIGVRI
ncbi:tetratricopeptide repeat protein [Paracrocinitomix mangrovi]|uniref:tetratricopeptide repeat protein n=1 Tax=Paracrocinitomix mangrovi TaxID=2862509 RepID=UPI001C8D8246|nr:tetratricopeptide repeat protein [Paracrocinitomix mangrovi]UKN01906.1 tetratricopeptide repeat protein [Paracrocinitomix mangrovi]